MTATSDKRKLRQGRGHFLREAALIALQTMRAHKLRSFLTLLGIILSVSTLILVVALISGMNLYFAQRVANLGSNVFLIEKIGIVPDWQDRINAERRNRDITWEDFEALRDGLKLPQAVGVEVRNPGKVRGEHRDLEEVDIRGVTANIADMDIQEIASGRYVSDGDNQHHAMVAVLGADVVKKLYPNSDPLGKTVSVDGEEFTVIGVYQAGGQRLRAIAGQLRLHSGPQLAEDVWAEEVADALTSSHAARNTWSGRAKKLACSCAPVAICRLTTRTISALWPATA